MKGGDSAADIARKVEKRAASVVQDADQVEVDPEFVRQCLDLNERGDGMLFSALFRDRFRYNVTPKDGEWYVWGGNVWQVDDFRVSVDAMEECAALYEAEADAQAKIIRERKIDKNHDEAWRIRLRKKFSSRADKLRGMAGVRRALDFAPVVDRSMACREEEFNRHPWLLPAANGVIDLETGTLTVGRPEDMMSKALDDEYDQHADYSPWHQTVVDICGSEEVANFVKRVFGYAITGFAHEQYIFVFVGPGRNGKGILFSLIGEVMGPYYHEIQRAMILQQRNEPSPGAATEHLYSLLDKRIIVGAETNRGQKIDEARVKELTGEDRIKCRPLYKSEISFMPTHTLFLHTNHVPHGLTSDFAMRQRILLIEFPFMYVDDPEAEARKQRHLADRFRKKDPLLKDKLRSHKRGILRWLVEGCLEWQEVGLSPPQSILKAVDDLAREEDHLGRFLEECIVHSDVPGTRLPFKALYTALEWWWQENIGRERSLPYKKTVSASLVERGYEKTNARETGGTVYILGVMLNQATAEQVDQFVASRGQ